jgi:cytochrome P450 family 110
VNAGISLPRAPAARRREGRFPPGPPDRRWEALKTSYGVYKDPLGAYLAAAARYGDPFTLPTLRGQLVVTADPEGAKELFGADPSCFEVWNASAFVPVLGATSVILSSGAPHTRLRKLLAPSFGSARIKAIGALVKDVTERAIRRWPRGTPFPMLTTMQAISFEIIARTIFSLDQDDEIDELRNAMVDMLTAAHPAILFFDVALNGALFDELRRNVGPWARARKAVERLDALIYAHIRRRRTGPARDDMLAAMMSAKGDDGAAMTDVELRNQLVTILIAGHETTASSLAWAMYRLHRHPEAKAKLLAELDLVSSSDPGALQSLPYLDAVCCETLRIHAVVTEASRHLKKPISFMGFDLPAGVTVAVSIALLNMREDLFPRPNEYRPERFLERDYGIFELAPFGGGVRRCIGASFAMYEMKIVLGTMLGSERLRLASADPVPTVRRGGVTLGPGGGGVLMVHEGRRSR